MTDSKEFMYESTRRVYELLCDAKNSYVWIVDTQGEEQLYMLEKIKLFVVPCDQIDDITINCQYTECIDLMLTLASEKRRMSIMKTVKCDGGQAECEADVNEILRKVGIRIPTMKELWGITKLLNKDVESLVMEVILFLKKWGLWKDVSILANGNMYSYSACKTDYYKGQEQIVFKENVDPSEYTTGPVQYEDGDERIIEWKNFSNPEQLFEMIYEGPLYMLFNYKEYEVEAKDIGLDGWDFIADNTSILSDFMAEEYGATTLEEYLENMKCMSFAEYSQRDREECMYSGWDPLVFDTWEEYLAMGGEEGTGLRPLYELYDTYSIYVEEMENFEELSLENLAPTWEQMVNDALEILANSNKKIYQPELAGHIWNEFAEIIDKYGLSFDFAFPWCLTCYVE